MGILCSGRANVWRGLNEAPVRNEPQPAQSLRSASGVPEGDNQSWKGCKNSISYSIGEQNMKNTIVKVWLDLSGEPIIHNGAISYQKGDFFCVYEEDKERVFKYPIAHIWRIEESYLPEQRAHLVKK